MIARAPGKLLLSGSYAILFGAPAVVTAVDRYATADSNHAAANPTPEVRAALANHQVAPSFDARELRAESQKLGLGSSAAILVASLGALRPHPLDETERAQLAKTALAAHRKAQGGGSGVDVMASVYGGTHVMRLNGDLVDRSPVGLPAGLHWSAWYSGRSAQTSGLVAQVRLLEAKEPLRFAELMSPHLAASEAAAAAFQRGDSEGLLRALAEQVEALTRLGEAALADIVPPDMQALHQAEWALGGVCLPSGAGGGDIMLRVGRNQPSRGFARQAFELGFTKLTLAFGATGLTLRSGDSEGAGG